ncbi:MAG: dUTP diphosphatase [Chitinophagaceae bacterium]|nr:dUTP diphosphatase [Chitinophagaceae bacterium]
MSTVRIPIINKSDNQLPEYATEGSAGMDLRANLETTIILQPMERFLVPTGIYMELPGGYEAQIRPRSGLALKQGITCLNSPGTVDSDYRGELKVILINLSGIVQEIHHGDRIAQIVIAKTEKAIWESVEKISVTSRNDGGFGHTGKK